MDAVTDFFGKDYKAPGFYWVRFPDDTSWTVGLLSAGESRWLTIGRGIYPPYLYQSSFAEIIGPITEKDSRSLELAEAAIKAYKDTAHDMRLCIEDFLAWADTIQKEEGECLSCMMVDKWKHQGGCEINSLRECMRQFNFGLGRDK